MKVKLRVIATCQIYRWHLVNLKNCTRNTKFMKRRLSTHSSCKKKKKNKQNHNPILHKTEGSRRERLLLRTLNVEQHTLLRVRGIYDFRRKDITGKSAHRQCDDVDYALNTQNLSVRGEDSVILSLAGIISQEIDPEIKPSRVEI